MFVDLDRFKTINDSLGHAVGDALLKEVASRLVKQLRIGDTICRIGGDEFVVVLPEVKRSSDVAHVAQKVIEQLSQPVVIEERELLVSCSIGIAVYPDDGRDAESLIRNADAAMYHAKELGRANYQFFTEQMNQAASRRLNLESDLRRAISRDELRVHYQPIVEAASGRVAAHEALVRWQHPERGLVHPVGIHPARRGDRPDPQDRRMGAAARRAAGPPSSARAVMTAVICRSRSTSRRGSSTTRSCPRSWLGCCARPACRRACSSSRSPSRPRCARPTPRCARCSA